MNDWVKSFGNNLVGFFHYIALFAIGSMTVYSAAMAFMVMGMQGYAGINDILLLFIYLEIGAMVGIYFKTNRMPVRFLIYIGITAMTRHLIEVMTEADDHGMEVLTTSITIFILALSVLIVKYASSRFPGSKEDIA
jgi:protein PsiE